MFPQGQQREGQGQMQPPNSRYCNKRYFSVFVCSQNQRINVGPAVRLNK